MLHARGPSSHTFLRNDCLCDSWLTQAYGCQGAQESLLNRVVRSILNHNLTECGDSLPDKFLTCTRQRVSGKTTSREKQGYTTRSRSTVPQSSIRLLAHGQFTNLVLVTASQRSEKAGSAASIHNVGHVCRPLQRFEQSCDGSEVGRLSACLEATRKKNKRNSTQHLSVDAKRAIYIHDHARFEMGPAMHGDVPFH